MNKIKGTKGYANGVQGFMASTLSIDFFELHAPFIKLIPGDCCGVLDIGAGIGRDAHIFAEMGHKVIAVEPTAEYLLVAKKLYPSPRIQWVDDCLPELSTLKNKTETFDFILVSAVWHHLDDTERLSAMERLTTLLKPNGILALSLRNGPAGLGTHVFPTCDIKTIKSAENWKLKTVLHIANQPSLMPGKMDVTWTFLAFSKIA